MNKVKNYFHKLRTNFKIIYQNFKDDQGFLKASNLGYITFLGFVPITMLIFLFTPDITKIKIQKTIIDFLFNTFFPSSATNIRELFTDLVARRFGMDVMGFILLFSTSFFLFQSISGAFDDILHYHKKQQHSFLRDFERFVAAIIGGVFIVVALLFTSSLPIINIIVRLTFIVKLIPYLSIFLFLFIMYKFVPHTRPKAIHALIGAIFTSIVWIILKICFDWYINTFTNVETIYSTLSALPIFLIWLYFNWVTILFGMEVVSFYQGVPSAKPVEEKKDKKTIRFKVSLERDLGKEETKKITSMDLSDSKEKKRKILKIFESILTPEQNQDKKEDEGKKCHTKEKTDEN